MFLQWIWFGMMAASLLYACFTGRAEQTLPAALAGTGDAITLIVNLGAGYLLFCGFLKILWKLNAPKRLSRVLAPLLERLLTGVRRSETKEAVSMNLAANLLGLGNAATPMGIRAMTLMEDERALRPTVRHAMYMLLIVNATSIQLLPTTVLTLRIAAGTADANAVIFPSLLCTVASTVVGVTLGVMCRRYMERTHA